MDAKTFRLWRKTMKLSQAGAARQLGYERRQIIRWEVENYPIPRAIDLACDALYRHLTGWTP